MRPATTLRDALDDPRLLGHVLSGPSWLPWRMLLIAAMGESLTDAERVIFRELTNREVEPGCPVEEFVGVIGRRGGKSRAISVLASFIAGLCQHRNLVPGERGVLLIIAPDTQQADIALGYIEANFRNSPILSQLVEARVARELRLTNGVDISVRASDFRRLRGPTFCCVIADEAAFWQTSEYSSNPDSEILRRGASWSGHYVGPDVYHQFSLRQKGGTFSVVSEKHFGPAGDPLVLVAQAPSRVMNPSLNENSG